MLSSLLWIPPAALLLTIRSVAAALVNATIDDHIYSSISYTYTRGATATFVFTGSAIWAQGPYADDQARRRISLDGVDQGAYDALAPQWSPSRPFWSKTGLPPTTHTVVITHDDPGSNAIMALDAFIVEYDNAEDPFLYTRTTVASYTPEATVATNSAGQVVSTIVNGGGSNQGGNINGNSVNDGQTSSRKPNTAIIIGVVISLVFVLTFCCIGFCLYRRRRVKGRAQHRGSIYKKGPRRIERPPAGDGAASSPSPVGLEGNHDSMRELGRGAATMPAEGQNPGYFHGKNQSDLGIPLYYRQSASVPSPTGDSRLSYQSQTLQGLAIDNGSTLRTASGKMEDSAVSSYTQPVPQHVLSTVGSSGNAQDPQISSRRPGEHEKKIEKETIVGGVGGSTSKGSMGTWNVGQGKVADQGTSNNPPDGNGTASRLGRSGSQRSRRSRRSISQERDDDLVRLRFDSLSGSCLVACQ
ncbi:hypothetical protein PIIN_02934 [Serendipita indica DSM 11827]|uniref:Uncharacterized protein n=1 Tax=Serendipita indica (strain DSM 11827) TaxID=1109443 RepID=G4TCM6_SERID|nr:hypothetical protein PIIN_02934 [Serendipita indica DSM 11827]